MTRHADTHDRIMALFSEIHELQEQIAAKFAEITRLRDADQEDSPER